MATPMARSHMRMWFPVAHGDNVGEPRPWCRNGSSADGAESEGDGEGEPESTVAGWSPFPWSGRRAGVGQAGGGETFGAAAESQAPQAWPTGSAWWHRR